MAKLTKEQIDEFNAKRKERRAEERLESKNEYMISDPTPKSAVDRIIRRA